ncbi:MAG: glycosyltransferase [Terriglobia bacterium]
MKLGAIYFLPGTVDYLLNSVQSVLPHVDSVLIGLNHGLFRGELSKSSLRKTLEADAKVQFVERNWSDKVDCQNTLIQSLRESGMSHVFILEPEQVYRQKELRAILEAVRSQPAVGQFQLRQHCYWKGLSYRVDPLDPVHSTIISRLSPGTLLKTDGTTNEQPIVLIPAETGVCHSFSYASPFHHVKSRLLGSGLTAELINDWKHRIWDPWDNHRTLRFLHPLKPERFRSAIPVNPALLPESLVGHPYLEDEIVGETKKPSPTFSIFLQANSPLPALQQTVEALVQSTFPDWELIVRLTGDLNEKRSYLDSKPGLKIVYSPNAGPDLEGWDPCVKASTGGFFIFLKDCLQLEGDWMEGILAALEGNPERVYLPAIVENPNEPQSVNARKMWFEQRRGRFYGQQSSLPSLPKWNELLCWACSRSLWPALLASDKSQCLTGTPTTIGNPAKVGATPPANSFQEEPQEQAVLYPPLHDSTIVCHVLEDTLLFASNGAGSLEMHRPAPDSQQLDNGVPPLVSIIIPVFNNLHFTRACLESIAQHTSAGTYEVIVVDNGSTDGTPSWLHSLTPPIRTIRNHKNLFFAGGCNRGGWAARGEYLLFLNNDVVVKPGWLDEMVKVLDEDPQIGIVGNKQLFAHTDPIYPNRVWHAGVILTPDVAPLQIYYGFDPAHPLVNIQRSYPAVIGSCFLIRRSLFQQLEGFDSLYQNGHEETDLCLRAGELGYRVVYTPKSEIVHYVSKTECRFDREEENLRAFRKRWKNRIVPSEPDCYRDTGLLPPTESRPPIRIGFVSPYCQTSALAAYAEHLLNEYPRGSFTVLGESGILDRYPVPDPPEVVRVWNRKSDWYYPLLRWTHSLDVDVVHINFDPELYSSELVKYLKDLKRAGKKTVVTLHRTPPISSPAMDICLQADVVVVPSSQHRLEMMAHGFRGEKLSVIPSGISIPSRQLMSEVRKRWGIPLAQKVVIYHGLMEVSPEFVGLVQSIAMLSQRMDLICLVIPPSPSDAAKDRDGCESIVRQQGMERHILFFGERLEEQEISSLFSCADAVIISPPQSGEIMVGAASLPLGASRPVLSYPGPSFPSLEDAVFRIAGKDSLTGSIESVLTNPLLSQELCKRARAFSTNHTWKRSAEMHWSLYRELLDEGRRDSVHLSDTNSVQTEAYPPDVIREIYRTVCNQDVGAFIEFGSRRLEITQSLQPKVSVTSDSRLCELAKVLGIETVVLSVSEFLASEHLHTVFDTIVVHASAQNDPCLSLVLSYLPHLTDHQRVLFFIESEESTAAYLDHKILQKNLPLMQKAWSTLGPSLRCLEITLATQISEISPATSSLDPDRTISSGASSRTGLTLPNAKPPWSILWKGPFFEWGDSGDSVRSDLLGAISGGFSIRIEDHSLSRGFLDGKENLLLRNLEQTRLTPSYVHVDRRFPQKWSKDDHSLWNVVHVSSTIEHLAPNSLATLKLVDAVWVPSKFHYDLCLQSGIPLDKLVYMPESLQLTPDEEKGSFVPLAGGRDLNFLSFIDERQPNQWELLLRGFLSQFSRSEDVALILGINTSTDAGLQKIANRIGSFIRERLGQDPTRVDNVLIVRHPPIADLCPLLRSSQAYVQVAPSGPGRRSLMRAMALGMPVIASPYGMNAELINESNGYPLGQAACHSNEISKGLPPDESVQQLAEYMRQIRNDFTKAKLRGEQARKEIHLQYSRKTMLTAMMKQFEEVSSRTGQRSQSRFHRKRARRQSEHPLPHLCWEGPQLVNHSLALVNRELESALLESRQAELSILPVGTDNFSASLSGKFKALVNHYGKDCGRPVDVHVRHQWPPNWTSPPEGHFVVIQPWEYGAVPETWVDNINASVDELWVPSSYVRALYIASGVSPDRVSIIPNGVDSDLFQPGLKPLKLPHSDSFKFLFLGGTIHRKGVDLLLDAFQRSFGSQDNVLLVIKDMGTSGIYQGQGLGEQIRPLQRNAGNPHIYYLDQDLTDGEIARLYNSCDCLVHPYRGEGFALPVLEAMSCGLPVIVTAGGPTDDFVNDATGYLIPAERRVFGNREISGLKTRKDLWMLEPNLESLTQLLRHVFQQRAEAKEKGRQARKKVLQHWSWNHAAQRVLQRVEAIRKEPVRRYLPSVDAAVLLDLDLSCVSPLGVAYDT